MHTNNFTKITKCRMGKGITDHLYLKNNELIQNLDRKYSYIIYEHQLSYESETMLCAVT
jgi:hypothetical protein